MGRRKQTNGATVDGGGEHLATGSLSPWWKQNKKNSTRAKKKTKRKQKKTNKQRKRRRAAVIAEYNDERLW